MKNIYWIILFFFACLSPLWAQEADQSHTLVKLISEQDALVAGGTSWVGLDFLLDDGWHVYWQNPGDSGLSPKVKWQLPSGVSVGGFQWPYPTRINVGPLTSYGYEHEVLLIVPVRVDAQFPSAQPVDLKAQVSWLACKDICIPGHAQVSLSLPLAVNLKGISYNKSQSLFDQTRQDLPQSIPSLNSHVFLDGNHWQLYIKAPLKQGSDIVFYPFRDDVIEHAAPEKAKRIGDVYQLTLTKSHIFQGSIKMLEGVAVNSLGWDDQGRIKAILIKAPIELMPVHLPFLLACLFALIGGLILNLMPCVLPVLSIKVLHLVERHPDKRIALGHSLAYALGILVSVWALGFLLVILKSAGQFAGWGFQFQSPIFVLVVAAILFVLALNLFGVFEFNIPAIGGLPTNQTGYQASFMSGIVTTIVASPCTAPFMGTALTAAISQPGIIGFGIFTFLGLGLALPFVLLSVFPSLLSFVPKPGMWMIRLKQFLGIVLLACVIWFLAVFGIQTGLGDLTKVFKPSADIQWQAYSSMDVAKARQSGKGVFLDFTAAWCINCQVNDRLVLQNTEVVHAFKDAGIIAFKGDWTKYDPAITQALASFGRDSIPVYVYYAPGANEPIILPQIITPKMITDLIKK